jgi:hypothetical protein
VEGYLTVTNLIYKGNVSHEIDVLAESNNNVIIMIECTQGEKLSDVKVPCMFSRFNDLKTTCYIFIKDTISKCWIATNNRFTSDAIDFAKCSGINLLSWDYPA